MIKTYCDTGAYRTELKRLEKDGIIELYQFKYENKNRNIKNMAIPSNPLVKEVNYLIRDFEGLDITIKEMGTTSEKYEEIKNIVGSNHRVDIKHIDSAYRTGCKVFLTNDKDDIGANASKLYNLLGMKIFHYIEEWEEFMDYASKNTANNAN